ncbi:Uncharacterized protein OBRU01_25765, partial [Operophtera brumata]
MCRYLSTLVTRQLGLTKSFDDNNTQLSSMFNEASTMKPTARDEVSCQTFVKRRCFQTPKLNASLSPLVNLMDVDEHDKHHLKSVYIMLTAIEGRLRRLKSNVQ